MNGQIISLDDNRVKPLDIFNGRNRLKRSNKLNHQLLGINQEFLSRQIGIDPGILRRWERGRGMPAKELLEKSLIQQ